MFIHHNQAQFFSVSFGDPSAQRTLLALGGWTGSWELWTAPFGYLSHTWRTVAYDHRGTGATIAPVESITSQTMVEDIFAIMDAFQIKSCVLAAESAGAAIALMAALQQPERFQGLVLIDGMYYNPVTDRQLMFVQGLKTQYEATLARFVDTSVPEPDSEAIRRWGRQILGRASQEAAIKLYECMFDVDLRAQLSQITQPTLILHGEKDYILPLESSNWLASQIPNNHYQTFPDTGHVPTVTRPYEVAEAIRQYFEPLI